MKYILTAVVVILILLSCKPGKKHEPQKPTTQDTIKVKKLYDVELVDTSMDIASERVMMARKKPKPPRPGEPPVEPPVVIGNGCILLDFDGQLVSGTMWNTGGDFFCESSGLSSQQISEVVALVKSYFGFEDSLLITTDESVYNLYPQNKRRRCIITTSNEWYGNNAGGVAYINSFTWFDNTPCFVFSDLLGLGNTKWIADAAAHEPGHTLGLRHHSNWTINPDSTCIKNDEYLWGDLIMGGSYYSPSPRFDIALNSLGCTYQFMQDDKKIITTKVRQ